MCTSRTRVGQAAEDGLAGDGRSCNRPGNGLFEVASNKIRKGGAAE